MRHVVLMVCIVVLVVAGSLTRLAHNARDREFNAITYPFVHEIMARMETKAGSAEALEICPSDGSRIIQRPVGVAVCESMHYNEVFYPPYREISHTTFYIYFYKTKDDAVERQHLALGRTIIEYGPSGLVDIRFNRWR